MSGGRFGAHFGAAPVLVLTTTGRRSGEPRRTSVLYALDGDRLVVIGSNTGSERHPSWALNLVARPEADVQIGRERKRVRATELTGSERARLWHLMSEQYGGFEMYSSKTARELKVFSLTPM